MWELDHKENWALKNWYFPTVVLEKTLESPLESKIKWGNPKGNHSWLFIGRTDAEAPILWPPNAKNQLTGKDPDAGKDWRQEAKGMAGDEMVESLTQWTWVWADSGRSWRTGKPAVLQSMGWQRVGHDLATEQQMHRSYWFYAMMSSISLGKFLASISSNMVHATFLVSPPLGFQRQS